MCYAPIVVQRIVALAWEDLMQVPLVSQGNNLFGFLPTQSHMNYTFFKKQHEQVFHSIMTHVIYGDKEDFSVAA